MDLRTQLATRFHIENIRELLHYIKEDERLREEIYRLIFDEDDIVSYQALWVCTHFSKPEVEWLTLKQDELIDAALTCPHSGKRRMLLNLLCQQQLADPPRVDLLDFCMERYLLFDALPLEAVHILAGPFFIGRIGITQQFYRCLANEYSTTQLNHGNRQTENQ